MAGIAFIARQASFDDAREVFPPVAEGLLGWFYPRGGPDRAAINYAAGGRDGAIVGSPVIQSGFMECQGGAHYLQTDLPETPAFTWLVAAANNDTLAGNATRPTLMGNYDNGLSGSSMWISTATVVAGNTFATTSTSRTLTVANVSAFRLYALQVAATGSITLHDLSAGISAHTALSSGHVVGGKKIAIGYAAASAFAGKSKIAHASFFDRLLDESELAALYSFIKFDLGHVGVAI